MVKETFIDQLRAQPFKPFALRLTDGALIPVPHPDFAILSRSGRTVFINTEGDRLKIVDLSLVTAIELASS